MLLTTPRSTIELRNGTLYWRNERGQLDRKHGPAIEYADGTKFWYRNDVLHNDSGPAVQWPNGEQHYYHNGVRTHVSVTP